MFLSVITPTYNRAFILTECYKSLLAQTCKDFEWIVVDDGSSDDTESLINSFIEEKILDIKYVKQNNAGKHVAHNTGAALASGEMFVCLDSDDQLTADAVEFAKQYWLKFGSQSVTGILAKRGSIATSEPICGTWPIGLESSTMFDLCNKYGFSGDTVLFFRTEILKEERFSVFEGERFMPETDLYCEIDKYGEILLVDRVLYLTEYLPGGLTSKYHTLLERNPNGAALTYYKQLCMANSPVLKAKYALLANMYKFIGKKSNKVVFSKERLWICLTALPAFLMKKRLLKRFKSGEKS